MPVPLLSGERTEPIHDAIFRDVCAAMPSARHARVPDAGHAASRDDPQAFDRIVPDVPAETLR